MAFSKRNGVVCLVRKKRKFSRVSLVIIVAVVALNFLGISYAHWSNDLEIMATITTAKFNPKFQNANISGRGDLKASKISDDKIVISGEVEADNYWADLKFMLKNESDIPVKVYLPGGTIIELSKQNDHKDLELPLGENNRYYEIICEQGTR